MSNNTTSPANQETEPAVLGYYPLALMIVGTPLNLLTLIVLSRSPFIDTKKQPAMHYLRVIAIFDTFMLYGWNLDHYLSVVHGFTLQSYTIPSCKITSFLSYFSGQSSAWFRVFVCFDRYLSLSRLHRTQLGQPTTIFVIIVCIIAVCFALNLHLLIFACFYDTSGEINPNAPQYVIYPMWDYVHLGVYNCVPFVLMVMFNSGVIYHLVQVRRTTTVHNSRIHHRSISITLVVTTTLFLVMTIPSSLGFSVFYAVANETALLVLDGIYFSYHILSFPLYFITLTTFRRSCIAIARCEKKENRVIVLNHLG